MKNDAYKTAAEEAYEIICRKIISGELSPGSKLTRRAMSELTNVSMIPVIEALHRLESEGLVDSVPQFGSHVIRLTNETIRDKFMMRLAVEAQVVRTLARHHTEEQLERFSFLSDDLDNTPRDEDHEDALWKRHYRFHMALAEATGFRTMVRTLRNLNLFDLLQKSILSYSVTHSEIPKDHHQKIIDAIRTGNPDHAEQVMRAHVLFSGLVAGE